MEETILNKIIEKKMRTLLDIINKNYPIKFKTENIDKELEYIIKHINIIVKDTNTQLEIEPIQKQSTNSKLKLKTNPKSLTLNIAIALENRCCARCWHDGDIFDRETMTKIKDIDRIFKVIDFKDINIKKFNKKYILGDQCKKSKTTSSENSKYCKLHSKHLIHGNYNDIPSKEICYHFMKDGKYL